MLERLLCSRWDIVGEELTRHNIVAVKPADEQELERMLPLKTGALTTPTAYPDLG